MRVCFYLNKCLVIVLFVFVVCSSGYGQSNKEYINMDGLYFNGLGALDLGKKSKSGGIPGFIGGTGNFGALGFAESESFGAVGFTIEPAFYFGRKKKPLRQYAYGCSLPFTSMSYDDDVSSFTFSPSFLFGVRIGRKSILDLKAGISFSGFSIYGYGYYGMRGFRMEAQYRRFLFDGKRVAFLLGISLDNGSSYDGPETYNLFLVKSGWAF
jgi:hypothetical protein